MQTEAITIQVSARAARAFRKADSATLHHIQDFLEFALMEDEEHDEAAFQTATDTLEQTVDEIGAKARARGLTDEKLQEILNGPKA